MWAKAVTWARALAALWVAIVVLLAVLQQFGVVPDAPRGEAVVWVVSLSIIAVDNVGTLISRRVHGRRTQRQAKLHKAAMGLVMTLAQAKEVRFEDIGVCIYIETRRSRVFKRARRLNHSSLRRIHRFRPSDYPQQSGVAWTSAKGTVGECWRQKKGSYKNWHAIAAKWGQAVLSDANFLKIPEATRAGFTREEFMSISGKYSEIYAEPIWHSAKEGVLLGVIAVDRLYSDEDDPFRPQIGAKRTRELASATASAVSRILKPKSDDD